MLHIFSVHLNDFLFEGHSGLTYLLFPTFCWMWHISWSVHLRDFLSEGLSSLTYLLLYVTYFSISRSVLLRDFLSEVLSPLTYLLFPIFCCMWHILVFQDPFLWELFFISRTFSPYLSIASDSLFSATYFIHSFERFFLSEGFSRLTHLLFPIFCCMWHISKSIPLRDFLSEGLSRLTHL